MKSLLTFSFLISQLNTALAEQTLSYLNFYNGQTNQVFKAINPSRLDVSYLPEEESAYLSWKGQLSGHSFYIEIHDWQLDIKTNSRNQHLDLSRANRLANAKPYSLDARGTEIFIRNSAKSESTVICLESLIAEMLRPSAEKTVYVILHPLTNPQVFQLPALFGSCLGLIEESPGKFIAPQWLSATPPTTEYKIQYLELGADGYQTTRRNLTARVTDNAERFTFSSLLH